MHSHTERSVCACPRPPLPHASTCHGREQPCNKPERLSLAQCRFSSVTTDLCLNISGLNHFTVIHDEVILPLSKIMPILCLGMLLIIKVTLLLGFRSLLCHCNVFS